MYPNVPIGIAAGLTAAIAMKMAAAAPNALGVPLIALLPLPIALAGLITNASTSFAAAGVAMLLLGVVTGVPAAFVFGLAAGLPASFLVHKALLHRDIGPGDTQWYPVGMIVVIAALIAAGVTAAGLVLATGLGSGIDKLEAAVAAAIDKMTATGWGGLSASGPLTDADKTQLTKVMLNLLPGSSAAFWMLSLLASLWLAAHIAKASGRLARPWPDLAAFKLPVGTPLLLAASLSAAILLSGLARLAALSFAGALFTAYVLLGLGIVHFNSRGARWRGPALGAFYVLVIALNSLATLLLAGLGLIDSFTPLRRLPDDRPPSHST